MSKHKEHLITIQVTCRGDGQVLKRAVDGALDGLMEKLCADKDIVDPGMFITTDLLK